MSSSTLPWTKVKPPYIHSRDYDSPPRSTVQLPRLLAAMLSSDFVPDRLGYIEPAFVADTARVADVCVTQRVHSPQQALHCAPPHARPSAWSAAPLGLPLAAVSREAPVIGDNILLAESYELIKRCTSQFFENIGEYNSVLFIIMRHYNEDC